ncbi:hypothetical protein GE09DRAFT_331062 [Coniochaeta sp. 2T2.1]|nr:hypothetical protein GE09DRAFT_331062 [Coniochaeta sp. 2T2.1]
MKGGSIGVLLAPCSSQTISHLPPGRDKNPERMGYIPRMISSSDTTHQPLRPHRWRPLLHTDKGPISNPQTTHQPHKAIPAKLLSHMRDEAASAISSSPLQVRCGVQIEHTVCASHRICSTCAHTRHGSTPDRTCTVESHRISHHGMQGQVG